MGCSGRKSSERHSTRTAVLPVSHFRLMSLRRTEMSVQTGIRYFDGRETSSQEIGFLLDGLEIRGPDYVNIFTSRYLGMGYRGFLVAPEEQENQPLIGRNGSALTFDGRLDGRANVCATRHLYYTADSKRVMWSSELDDLVMKSAIDPVVNDRYAIGFVYYQPDVDESPFRDIAVVPPGAYVQLK